MRASAAKTPIKRLYIFAAVLAVWIVIIALQLVRLQIFRYGEFLARLQRQTIRTIPVEPRRGYIYDRNGHQLAVSIDVDSVFAVPSEVHDRPTTAQLLGRVLNMDPQEIMTRMAASKTFTFIARKIDDDTSQRIRQLNLRGIYFLKEPKRFYPNRELAAQALGYVGLDDEGLSGLERQYDDDLRGIPGKELISVDARRKSFSGVEKPADPGRDLVLTIDHNIQYIAERELQRGMEETHAIAGTVVIQNPRTGEILALTNRPTFNPNKYGEITPDAMKNRAVSDIYEPGSVFKIVTYSAAIDQHIVKPDDLVDCQHGSIDVFGMHIRDHESLGTITIAEALAHSSDVAAIKVGMRLGEDRLYHYLRDYGFGSQSGIELPGETRGLTKPVNRWSKVSIAAISMGQEIGVTPLQAISMVSTIANDGVYSAPRIVAGELPPDGQPKPVVYHPANQHRVVTSMTAVQMKKMMEGVVLFGTARRAILDGYTSAGKTGTAQKVDPATGGYSKTKYVASFVGFTPINSPAITIAVILDSPTGLHQGGQVCAPIFKRIAEAVLEYLHVPHDAEPEDPKRLNLIAAAKDVDVEEGPSEHLGTLDVSDDTTKTPAAPTGETLVAQAKSMGMKPAAMELPGTQGASNTVRPPIPDLPLPPEPANRNGTVVLDVDSGTVVPSFLGKPLRSAVEIAAQSGLEINAIGSGIAREQSPAAGSRLPAGRHITVRFSN